MPVARIRVHGNAVVAGGTDGRRKRQDVDDDESWAVLKGLDTDEAPLQADIERRLSGW